MKSRNITAWSCVGNWVSHLALAFDRWQQHAGESVGELMTVDVVMQVTIRQLMLEVVLG